MGCFHGYLRRQAGCGTIRPLFGRFFDRWVQLMLDHRRAWLLAIAVLTLGMGGYASQLPLMTTLQDLLPSSTPGMELYEPARERFGGDETTFLALQAEDHFSEAGLQRLQRATELIEAHPFIERAVSLTNVQELWTEDGSLMIDTLVREGRSSDAVRKAATRRDTLQGSLISADGRFALIVAQAVASTNEVGSREALQAQIAERTAHFPPSVRVSRDANKARRLLELSKQKLGYELVDLVQGAGYKEEQVFAVGFTPLISQMLMEAEKNLNKLFPLTVLGVALTLLLLFRRPLDTILPLICIGPAVIWAVAMGGLVFGRITLMTTVAPVMVMVVGVSDVVHLVTQFRHELARGHEKREAIRLAFRQVGLACTLTSVTTLIGFGSMILLPLPTSQELGVTSGFGVVAAFLLSFILTPILLSYTNPKPEQDQKTSLLSGMLSSLADIILPRPKLVAALGVVATAGAIFALSQQKVENSLTRKLSADHPMRLAVKTVEGAFGSSQELEVLIDAGAPGGFKNPELIKAIAELAKRMETVPGVEDTLSIVDVLEELHRLMAPARAQVEPLPIESRQQIAQYLLLFEVSGGEQLDSLVDGSLQHGRLIVRGRDGTAEMAIEAAQKYDAWAKELMPKGVVATAGGIGLLAARLGPAIYASTLKGFTTAMLLIALVIVVLFRSVRVGVLSLIPNLFPVAAGLAMVPVFFEQIDVDTMTFIPICVGIAVDDTLHFLARYRIERERGSERSAAVRDTICEAGHGIVRTSLILVAGFTILLMADYQPVATVGLLLPVTLMTAVLMDLIVVPAMALLGLFDGRYAGDGS